MMEYRLNSRYLFVDFPSYRPGRFSMSFQFVCYLDPLTCSFLEIEKRVLKDGFGPRQDRMPATPALEG